MSSDSNPTPFRGRKNPHTALRRSAVALLSLAGQANTLSMNGDHILGIQHREYNNNTSDDSEISHNKDIYIAFCTIEVNHAHLVSIDVVHSVRC